MSNLVDFVLCGIGAALISHAGDDPLALWGGIMLLASGVRARVRE